MNVGFLHNGEECPDYAAAEDIAGKDRAVAVKVFDEESENVRIFILYFNSLLLRFLEPTSQALGEPF